VGLGVREVVKLNVPFMAGVWIIFGTTQLAC